MHDAYAPPPEEPISGLRQTHSVYVDSSDAGQYALARELHDTVIQPLTSLVVSLTGLSDQQSYPSHLADQVEIWQALAREALDSLRSTLAGLSAGPQAPHELSLTDMLRTTMLPQLTHQGIWLTLHADHWPAKLPSGWTTQLFLAIREALTNTVKHASASTISVQLKGDAGGLTITITDDGTGCSPDELYSRRFSMSGHGLGIGSIQDRIRSLGGWIHIRTAPGCGMRIVMHVPHGLQEN